MTIAMNRFGDKLASGHEVFSDTEPDDYQAGGDAIVTQEGEVVYSFHGSTPGLHPPVEELRFSRHLTSITQLHSSRARTDYYSYNYSSLLAQL